MPLALFGVSVQRRIGSWWLLVPLALITWALVHASGVHATVAAVLLAFTVPVLRSDAAGGTLAGPGMAEHFEHAWRPVSTAVAVPIFAFLSAGVTIGGLSGLRESLTDRVAIGIVVGLIARKTVGVLAATWVPPNSPAPPSMPIAHVGEVPLDVLASDRPGPGWHPVDSQIVGERLPHR